MNIKARIASASPHLIEVDFSSLRWNKTAQRYISPRGKFIDPKAVREVIDADIVATQNRLQNIGKVLSGASNDYQNGQITKAEYQKTLRTFHDEMRREVKNMHLANTMAAKGGIASMDQSAYGQAGKQLQFHYGKLDDFVEELKNNPKLATNEEAGRLNFERRINMYGEAGRFTYETIRQQSHLAAGFKYVQNILEDGAHHCHTSKKGIIGCTEQTEKGRVPIDEMVMIGKRACGPADKCNLKYYKYQKRQTV